MVYANCCDTNYIFISVFFKTTTSTFCEGLERLLDCRGMLLVYVVVVVVKHIHAFTLYTLNCYIYPLPLG